MNTTTKGKNYNYTKIKEFAEDNDYEIHEFGSEIIGENFIVLKNEKYDLTISFVLTGTSGPGFIYECIYSDIKEVSEEENKFIDIKCPECKKMTLIYNKSREEYNCDTCGLIIEPALVKEIKCPGCGENNTVQVNTTLEDFHCKECGWSPS